MAGRDTNIGAKRARDAREELGIDATRAAGLRAHGRRARSRAARRRRGAARRASPAAAGATATTSCSGSTARRRRCASASRSRTRSATCAAGTTHDVPVETFETLGGKSTDAREVQANAFAAELLAPADGVRATVDGEPSLEDVVLIAARYGISAIAALYRLNTLGLTARYDALKQEIAGRAARRASASGSRRQVVVDAIAAIEPAALPRLSPALDRLRAGGDRRGRGLRCRRGRRGRLRSGPARRAARPRSACELRPSGPPRKSRSSSSIGVRTRARARARRGRARRCPRRSTGRRPPRRGRTPARRRARRGRSQLIAVGAEDRGERVEQPP